MNSLRLWRRSVGPVLVCMLVALQVGCSRDNSSLKERGELLVLQDGQDVGSSQIPHNVVLILIDDLSHYGFTTYGSNLIRSKHGHFEDRSFSTPNIDQLAYEGIRMERAYAHPLCENTRVALMSGKQNNRNYVQPKALHESEITFGDLFKRAGYATGIFGKWKQTRGSTDKPAKTYVENFGWDSYTLFDVVEEGQRFINPNLIVNGVSEDYRGRTDIDPETGRRWYGPDIFNRDALAFIDKNKDKPFFLYYPMALVHDDHKPTPDTNPNSLFDQFDEATHNKDGHHGDDPKYLTDMIEYTDKLIGNVVAKLDELKLRERTLIIVMGDNGTKEIFTHVLADGSEYKGRKGGNADNGIHVGMVVNQPSVIPAGTNSARSYDGLVYLTDVLPTMLDATGVQNAPNNTLDGKSFWAQALGEPSEARETIHSWYIGNAHWDMEENMFKTEYVFDKHYKRYAPSMHYPEGRFFDLRTDLFEKTGERFVPLRWSLRRYSGLDLNALSGEQQEAYKRLGNTLEQYAFSPVDHINIIASSNDIELELGERLSLGYQVLPKNATRDGVIWKSSAPAIVSVDKFGELAAHSMGEASIQLYSWSDANPVANGKSPDIQRSGLSDSIVVRVR